jgi:hypothetical protein
MAFTLALLGYTMMDSSKDKPTPMQIPLILLMVTCSAPARAQSCMMQSLLFFV